MTMEEKLSQLHIQLKESKDISKDVSAYVRTGSLVFTSGMLPFQKDGSVPKGRVGQDFTTEQAQTFVRDVCVELLSILNDAACGLDHVRRIVMLQCYVNCTPDYMEQSVLFNTASDLFGAIFGEKGKHARFALGMNALPMNVPVEISLIAEVE